MATKIYLDKRSAKKDGTYPLKISVSYKGAYTLIPTGIYLLPEHWDETSNKVIKHISRTSLNQLVRTRLSVIELCLINMQGKRPKSGKELRTIIERAISGNSYDDEDKCLFCQYMESFMNSRKAQSTKELYAYTLGRIKAYTENWESLTFDDITYKWLTSFSEYLECKTNTVSIHLRNIRAVFNEAIKNDIITCYPFRKFKIEQEATPKRSLLPEQLAMLRDYECEEHQKKYRDIFMLIFYLIGINTKDLFSLTSKNAVNGRIEYRRAKTGRWYSIKLEPEAMVLIERYKGKNYLLSVLDEYGNYKDFQHRMNDNLSEIGPTVRKGLGGKKYREPLFPELTTYWARHSWATIAHKIGISKDVISMALGHSFGCKTTDIYIDFDRDKVDEANRKVIDYINKCRK